MHWVLLPFPIWCHLCSLLTGVSDPASVAVSDPVSVAVSDLILVTVSYPVSVAVSDPALFVVFGCALVSVTVSHFVPPLFQCRLLCLI